MRNSLVVMLSLFAMPCVAAYDPAQIKQFISDKRELFKIKKWQGSNEAKQWKSQSEIKLLRVEIDSQQTKIRSPYFSPQVRKAAKARCTAVASLALGVTTAEEKDAIRKTIDKATQHHRRQSFELNNVRFEAMPVLKGPFVTMHCSVMPAEASGK